MRIGEFKPTRSAKVLTPPATLTVGLIRPFDRHPNESMITGKTSSNSFSFTEFQTPRAMYQ